MKEYRKPDLHRLGRIADMTRNHPGAGADAGSAGFEADMPPYSN